MQKLNKLLKEQQTLLTEYSNKYQNTIVTITGVEKGEAKRLFTIITKKIDDYNSPKNIRLDY